VAALRERLATLNPAADIVTVTHGELDPAAIQNLGLWNAATRSLEVARWLKPQRYQPASAGKLGGKPRTELHDARIQAFSVVLDAPLDRYGLQSALSMLTSFRAENLLRFKAIVNLQVNPAGGAARRAARADPEVTPTPGRTPTIAAASYSSCAISSPGSSPLLTDFPAQLPAMPAAP
jgi:G3E family GTPase